MSVPPPFPALARAAQPLVAARGAPPPFPSAARSVQPRSAERPAPPFSGAGASTRTGAVQGAPLPPPFSMRARSLQAAAEATTPYPLAASQATASPYLADAKTYDQAIEALLAGVTMPAGLAKNRVQYDAKQANYGMAFHDSGTTTIPIGRLGFGSVAVLHSTLVHELTHAWQFTEPGATVSQDATSVAASAFVFGVRAAATKRDKALEYVQEVEAHYQEIAHRGESGVTNAYLVDTVGPKLFEYTWGLWEYTKGNLGKLKPVWMAYREKALGLAKAAYGVLVTIDKTKADAAWAKYCAGLE